MRKGPDGSSKTRTLAQKLGIRPGMSAFFYNLPNDYFDRIGMDKSLFAHYGAEPFHFAHLFLSTTIELEHWLSQLHSTIEPSGMIWVSWNKKSSGIETELTEDIIRDTALALGLVDIKVCSINADWSALKLVIRKELR
jgi:hypothetical protein